MLELGCIALQLGFLTQVTDVLKTLRVCKPLIYKHKLNAARTGVQLP